MRGQRNGIILPAGQTKQSTDSKPPESGLVTTLCAIEPPIKITFGTGGMQIMVNRAVVRFLVHNECLGAGPNNRLIFGRR